MNNRHKYFRNLRYKQKLEARYDNYDGWHTGVYFTTKEPDPRQMRELQHARYGNNKPEKFLGHDFYLCWRRPEVSYSIREFVWGRNGWKQVMKQQTSRRNRHIKITEDDVAVREKGFYKKVEDIWNYD